MYAGTYIFSDTKNAFTPKNLLPLIKGGIFPKENTTIANLNGMYPEAPEAWVGHVSDAAMYLTEDAGSALFAEMNRLQKDLTFTVKGPKTNAPELSRLVAILRKLGKAWSPHKFQKQTLRMRAFIYKNDRDGSDWCGEVNKKKEYALGIHFGGSIRIRWNVFKNGVPTNPECTSMTLKHGSLFVLDKAALCGEWKRYSVPAYRMTCGPRQFHAWLDEKMRLEWKRKRNKRGIKGAWVEQVKKKQKTLRQCAAEDSENDPQRYNAATPPNTPLPGITSPTILDTIQSPHFWCLPLEEQMDISEPKDDYWKNMGEDLMEEWELTPKNIKDFAYNCKSGFKEEVDQLLHEDMNRIIEEYF